MKQVDVSELRAWTTNDSAELYNIEAWGAGYFHVNAAGNVSVGLEKDSAVDLKSVVDDLIKRGVRLPVVLRFSDLLADQVARISKAFQQAVTELNYKGQYLGVYPIKVNQERLVVEELVRFGREYGLGLEAGSKPELLIALALQTNSESLLICNGYKDREYIDLALCAQRLGRRAIIVLDRYEEVELVLERMAVLGLRPLLGVRTKLFARGAGHWSNSTGDRSKFGLTKIELVRIVERLGEAGALDCLRLLHFHIGSQITSIRAIKRSLAEASRIYIELKRLGAPLTYLDVGGGLAVDYDGSRTNFGSSANYDLSEYAADVVSGIGDACDEAEVEHPIIITESGRFLTAHHSVLIFDVLGRSRFPLGDPPDVKPDEHRVLVDLADVYAIVNRKNIQECYHDALQYREETQTLFNVGVLGLADAARAERLFWLICSRVLSLSRELSYIPEELKGLTRALADTYYCNFSVFQSLPDHWACKHLFPTMPIHRLTERPVRCATLADLTCDSDGKVDRFIDLHDVKDVLELHELESGQPYYLGSFLVGAYQEILGDLHNLFGDTHCVHLSLDDNGGYHIDEFEDGETIQDVLTAVSYERRALLTSIRQAAEKQVKEGLISLEESAALLRRYERSLGAYTYLSDEAGGAD